MNKKGRVAFIVVLFVAAVAPLSVPQSSGQLKQNVNGLVYHKRAPRGPLPETLDPSKLSDNRAVFVTYTLAAKIRRILYQEPCFCPCHKEQGHQSLLDCFAGNHGVSCHLCKQEVIFCYEQYLSGKSAKDIRAGLMGHEWSKIDVDKYVQDWFSRAQ